jgi:hypothetical protein
MTIYRQYPASRIFRYCTRQIPVARQCLPLHGQVVPDIPGGVLAVYAERRQDRDGPYALSDEYHPELTIKRL